MNLKRILSFILALVMVVGYVPSVFADESAPVVTVTETGEIPHAPPDESREDTPPESEAASVPTETADLPEATDPSTEAPTESTEVPTSPETVPTAESEEAIDTTAPSEPTEETVVPEATEGDGSTEPTSADSDTPSAEDDVSDLTDPTEEPSATEATEDEAISDETSEDEVPSDETSEDEPPSDEASEEDDLQVSDDSESEEEADEEAVAPIADLINCTIAPYDAFYLPAKYPVSIDYTLPDGSQHNTKDLQQVTWHYVDDKSNPGYCLEPDKQCGYGYGWKDKEFTTIGAENTGSTGSEVWTTLTSAQQTAIGLVILYGVPNYSWDEAQGFNNPATNTNRGYFAAGQILVWEFVMGLRSPYWPYNYTSHPNATALYNAFDGQFTFTECYHNLYNLLYQHYLYPSFSSNAKSDAPTIELKYDGSGYYIATVTDTNGILSKFDFQDPSGNVIFSRSGNTLSIRAKKLPDNPTFSASKMVPSPYRAGYYLAFGERQTQYQALVTAIPGSQDPVNAYFKLKLPDQTVNVEKTSTDGKVSGISFTVKNNTTGATGTYKTDSKGKFSFTAGIGDSITITEVVPNGYTAEVQSQTIIVSSSGNKVTFKNIAITGTVQVTKTNSKTGAKLSGAVFELTDSQGNKHILKETSKGVYKATGIPFGKATIKEIEAPPGHILNSKSFTVNITENGKTYTLTVPNEPILGTVEVIKTDSQSSEKLSGAVFELTDSEGNKHTLKETSKGIYKATGIPYGTATIKEIEAPSGHVLNTTSFTVEITENGKTYSITIPNDPILGSVEVIKIDSETKAKLSGAVFEITDSKGTKHTMEEVSVGVYVATNIPYGKATIKEVTPPDRYILETKTFEVFIGEHGAKYAIEIPNTPASGNVEVIKTDAETGAKLSGAVFHLTDCNGTVHVMEEISTGVYRAEKLPLGEATVQEISAPEGYALNPNPFTVEIEENGKTYTITVPNSPVSGSIKVMKATTSGIGADLGWTFHLSKVEDVENPSDKESWTYIGSGTTKQDKDDPSYTFEGLAPGLYAIEEDPDNLHPGYQADLTTHFVELTGTDTVSVTVTNVHLGSIQITKTTNTGADLGGWKVDLYDSEKIYISTYTIPESGTLVIADLIPGTYYLAEQEANNRYWVCDTEEKTAEVAPGGTASVQFSNTQYGTILIKKTMEGSGPLAGWQFKVTDTSTNEEVEGSPFTSSEDGTIETGLLPGGEYIVEEIIPENSPYICISENPVTITVAEGETAEVSFTNKLRTGRFEIIKVNFAGTRLAGAKLLLEWSEDGTNWQPVTSTTDPDFIKGGCTSENLVDGCLVTDETGYVAFEGLHPEVQYRLSEIEAPEGYVLLADYAYLGTLPLDDLVVELTIHNSTGYLLPETGVSDFTFLTVTISTIIALMAIMMGTVMMFNRFSIGTSCRENKSNNQKGSTKMKKSIISRIFSLALVICILGSIALPSFAAEPSQTSSVIDTSRKGSFELYKYDMTNAEKDGVWDSSYVSTGVYDQNVNDKLGGSNRAGDNDNVSNLGNGSSSNGYAIAGVEFTYLKVAEIFQYTATTGDDGSAYTHVEMLYGFNPSTGMPLLNAIGLNAGNRFTAADPADGSVLYFQSNVLVTALRNALAADATSVKNALEAYVKNGGTAMPLTDAKGYTSASDLDLGLYLVVETKVPEMVTNTCNPFFLSLPMTSIAGTNVADGGTHWIYDVTLYPKNETGIPTLEKTVRESKADTGKNNASSSITDGFAHTGTGSAGDVMEYQIISTLPSITSTASQLSIYTFLDTLQEGLTYNKNDVVLEFFTDAACATTPVATWTEDSGKFTVTYEPAPANGSVESKMTIAMTEAGLSEINTSTAVYSSDVRRGYSDLTLRITYSATIDSDKSVTFGDAGNCNEVVLTWKRSSTSYYDTLIDDCHVYTYIIDLTKVFTDKDGNPTAEGDFSKVEFVLYNNTDKYWVKAELTEEEGVYYVVDHLPAAEHGGVDAEASAEAAGATKFIPTEDGKVIIKGLEDDEYILTEIRTDSGYTLLKDHIIVSIKCVETADNCDIYAEDMLGLIQNDPRYATVLNPAGVDTVLGLKNMPQKHLEHKLLTASATVDGNAVNMLAENNSENAKVPMTVVNTHGFDLPQTGEVGLTWMPIIGGTAFGIALLVLFFVLPKRKEDANA